MKFLLELYFVVFLTASAFAANCIELKPKACTPRGEACSAEYGSSNYLLNDRVYADTIKYRDIEDAVTCGIGLGCYNSKCEGNLIDNLCTEDTNCTGGRGGPTADVLWDFAQEQQNSRCSTGVCKFEGTFGPGGDISGVFDVKCNVVAEFGICQGRKENEICSNDEECGPGMFCNATASSRCTGLVDAGGSCKVSDTACWPYLFCDSSSKVCMEYNTKTEGTNCSAVEECEKGLMCLGEKAEASSNTVCTKPPEDRGAICERINMNVGVIGNVNCYKGEECYCMGTAGSGQCYAVIASGKDSQCERCLRRSEQCGAFDTNVHPGSCAYRFCRHECSCKEYHAVCTVLNDRFQRPLLDSRCKDQVYDYLDYWLHCPGYSKCSHGVLSFVSHALAWFSAFLFL